MTGRAKQAVSAADVARAAGVSRSAVSRAFTPGGCVSAQARRRILQAAEDMGYKVNRLARSLHQERSDLVGVVGSNFSNPYISAQIDALSHALREAGLHCLLLNAADDQDDLAGLLEYRVRTVVMLSGAAPDKLIRLCAANGARMVLINRPAPTCRAQADLIMADSAGGGKMAAQRLRKAGCRHVAVVSSGARTSAKRARATAFCQEMQRHSIPVEVWARGPNSYETGVHAARHLLGGPQGQTPKIDGIFGVTDEIALGVLNTARHEIGLRVPEDLAVIGFDDAPISQWSSHGLTTIRQSLPALTRATLEAIAREPDAPPSLIQIPVELVERSSVARSVD
ncbi:LacI family DNA-binding transcriptional regulator [Rhodobacteraceae bacterium]|nr:LacI family DNA-binding transcriptional regulator [Paracoccaceae bacterium]